MVDVKVLASQSFLKRLKETVKTGNENLGVNSERYNEFRNVFGAENYGFILVGDLQKEIRFGIKAPVYLFGEELYPSEVQERGIDCKLFLPSNFKIKEDTFSSRMEVEEILNYLEISRKKGNIGNLVNSKRGTLFEDKISILELQAQGIRTPKSFHFLTFGKLRSFVLGVKGRYILKHRFGQQGKQLFRINGRSIQKYRNLNIGDFIVQEELDITDEKRLIFFDGEFLGARIIYDRHMPWEQKGKAGRKHITEKYSPTKEEINQSRRILKHSDILAGCVDWVEVNARGRFYLELNGIGTGWGKGKHPYNFNKTIAEKLKLKYLN